MEKEIIEKIDRVIELVPEDKREEARTRIEEIAQRAAATPTEIDIPVSEVVKRYPVTEAIEVVRCKKEVFLHSANFYLVVRPGVANNMQGGSLYQALVWFCESIDRRDTETDEEKTLHAQYRDLMIALLTLPSEMFGDVEYSVALGKAITEEKVKYYERLLKTARERGLLPETEGDAKANAEFAEAVQKVGAISIAIDKLAENGNK